MTRNELGQLYKAKTDVEKANDHLAGINAQAARHYLGDALWTMKQLIDAAVIEHDTENSKTSLDEQAAQGDQHGRRSV